MLSDSTDVFFCLCWAPSLEVTSLGVLLEILISESESEWALLARYVYTYEELGEETVPVSGRSGAQSSVASTRR